MHKFTKKRIAIGALGLLVVVGAAFAYFTTEGEGEGTAEVGKNSKLVIHAEIEHTPLYPGTKAGVTFNVDNSSPGHQYVDTISLAGVTAYPSEEDAEKEEHAIGGCSSSWFKLVEPAQPVLEETDVAPGNAKPLPNGSKLEFVNKTTEPQDACQEAFLVAHFTSN